MNEETTQTQQPMLQEINWATETSELQKPRKPRKPIQKPIPTQKPAKSYSPTW